MTAPFGTATASHASCSDFVAPGPLISPQTALMALDYCREQSADFTQTSGKNAN
jgi:hypothetical protein